MRYLAIILLCINVSCGTDEPVAESQTTAADFESSDPAIEYNNDYIRLPRCTKGKDEVVIYLRYEEILLVCRDKMWLYFDDPTDPEEDACPITKPYTDEDPDDDEEEQEVDDDDDDEEV